MKNNYQITLDKTLQGFNSTKKRLLLHACCAPCSSYVLEYLTSHFDITVFFYNPNITEAEEYEKRSKELVRLIDELPHKNEISFLYGEYEPTEFTKIAKGMEKEPEGGKRCFGCYRLRLKKTAEEAKKGGFDYFTTTLTISPHKNAEVLNTIGKEESEIVGIPYLYSDFKKKNGYKRSCELSVEYNLYRQDYCGCIYSKLEREEEKANER